MPEPIVVEVFHPYRAQERHQLTITVGEKLTVIEKDASGWWVGRNAKGIVGVFPSTYTKKATNVAPTAEVTRDIVAARLLTEIGIRPYGTDENGEKTFAGATNLDYDDVYAMTAPELEREVKRLMVAKEHERRVFAEAMEKLVDDAIAQRGSGGISTVGLVVSNAVATETQRLKIGKKRLEELIVSESQLKDELKEWEDILRVKRIECPEVLRRAQQEVNNELERSLTPNTSVASPVSEQPQTLTQGANRGQDTQSSDAEEEWLQGVTVQSLVPYLKKLQKKFMKTNTKLDEMEAAMEPIAAKMQTLEAAVKERQEQLDRVAESHQEKVKELFEYWEGRVSAAKAELDQLREGGAQVGQRLIVSLKDQIQMLERQIDVGKKEYNAAEEAVELLRHKVATIKEMSQLTAQTEALRKNISDLAAKESALRKEALDIVSNGKAASAEDQLTYRKLERKRRETYNEIQELKGNLRVYCRVKPVGKGESNEFVEVLDDMTIRITDPASEFSSEHEFDFVIPEHASQEEIFEEVRPLATSVLDGYNVCIFAYGQTGSGKTYTMEGPPDNRGINFRCVKELFSIARERGEEYHCVMTVSIMEVYNDKLYDLQNKRSLSKIRWSGDEQGVVIEPVVKHAVSGVDDVQDALEKAYKNRSIAGTDCNAHSSRSHCILTVYVNATNSASNQTISAKLHLVDLAGSERVKNSGVEGDRLKEATHINSSLTHLKTVIQGLANKSSFVAYRNSTLTSMLQDSLGGNCKCLMFANISAATHNIPESLCTMKYAAEARKVEVGKVSANVKKK